MKKCLFPPAKVAKKSVRNKFFTKLFHFDHGNARSAELNVFVVVRFDGGGVVQIVAYGLPQRACACAVKYAYGVAGEHLGIVDEVHDGCQCLVDVHAAYIDFGLECQTALVYGVDGGVGRCCRACAMGVRL